MTTTGVTLNGVTLAAAVPTALVQKVVRPLVGKRRHSDVLIPGRAGALRYDEEPGNRTLEVEIDILAATFEERRAAVRALAEWADVGTTSALVFDDEPDRYHLAILDNDPDGDEWLTHAGTIVLRFDAGPYTYSDTVSTQIVTATTNPDNANTFTIPDEIYAEPIIELTPAGGTMTGFTLTVNGFEITWAGGPILAGETLTISSLSDTVTLGVSGDVNLTGAYDPNTVAMTDVDGLFPLLLSGLNEWSIEWTGTATSIGLEFTWRERSR